MIPVASDAAYKDAVIAQVADAAADSD